MGLVDGLTPAVDLGGTSSVFLSAGSAGAVAAATVGDAVSGVSLDAFSLEARLAGSVAPAADASRRAAGQFQINTGPAPGADASGESRSTDFSSASSTASDGMRVGLTFATGASSAGAQPPSTPSLHAAVPDAWQPHPMDPLRFVKAEIRQLLLQRGALSIAQLPEEYLKCYRKPLTQALKKLDSQYTPESARSGKPSGRARKSTLGAFLREHLTDVVEVRQRPHGQHEIVAAGVGGSPALGDAPNGEDAGGATPSLLQLQQQQQMRARRLQQQQQLLQMQWRQDTPKHATQALVSQQQQQQQQRRQLNQLRDALHQVNVGDSPRRSLERTPTMFSTLSPTYSGGPLPASPRSDDVSLNLPADINEPLMSSKPVRDALMSASAQQIGAFSAGGASTFAPHAAANLLAASHPSAGAGAIAAAAVGALRGAALLSATASDIPAENRIYVTWRVPSKATQLRVEDLWGYFSRFGQLAFCNPRPLRNSNAPRRTPSLSGAGYAFLGFSNPGGAEAVTRVLSRPSHALRGAELRVKQWRDRDEGTGMGDTPAVVPSSAVDAPPATVGEYYFAHPESGVPVLAPSVDSASVGGLASSTAASRTVAGARDFFPSAKTTPAEATMLDGHLSDGSDAKALHGEGFFNLGSDGNLDARDVVDSAAETKRELASRASVSADGGFGTLWSVGSTKTPLFPGSSGGTFNPWGFGEDSGVDDGPDDGPDDGMRKSRLWNYTSGGSPPSAEN